MPLRCLGLVIQAAENSRLPSRNGHSRSALRKVAIRGKLREKRHLMLTSETARTKLMGEV